MLPLSTLLNTLTCGSVVVVLIFLQLPTAVRAESTVHTGTIALGCTDGNCNISGVCDDLTVPGSAALEDDGVYQNINGEVILTPSTCTAECDEGCTSIPGSDQDENGCIGSAGYVFCPETDECIRPWLDNCPFEGTLFVGPTNITCINGRCNNLTRTCDVVIDTFTVGGPYLSDLNGEYELSAGCSATCDGCTMDSETDSVAPTPSLTVAIFPSAMATMLSVVSVTSLLIAM